MSTPDFERDPGAKQVCPWYVECCRYWEINPITDKYCVRERQETVLECTELDVTLEDDLAFVSFAPSDKAGDSPRAMGSVPEEST